MARLPKKVTERLNKQVRRFQRILEKAKDRDINESDTVVIVTDMLANIFGFNKYSEITSEYAIRGTYCDLAIKVDGKLKFLIEVKAIGLDLKDSHLRQAVGYGAQNGIQWVVLTNGQDWELYRIKFERPIDHELLCKFNFFDINTRKQEHNDFLFLLCKEGISRDVIEEYHEHILGVNKFVISAILQSDTGLALLKRELRRVSPGIQVDTKEIEEILKAEVLKRDVLEGDSADEAKTRVRRSSNRKLVKR